jgi:hypothetical protein
MLLKNDGRLEFFFPKKQKPLILLYFASQKTDFTQTLETQSKLTNWLGGALLTKQKALVLFPRRQLFINPSTLI